MMKFEIIKLINAKPYEKKYNLEKDMRGIILNEGPNCIDVLFFNPQKMGNYVLASINLLDIKKEEESLPDWVKEEMVVNADKFIKNSSGRLEPVPFKNYSFVELIVEDDKYSKYGIHKGDRGCVMDNKVIENHIEVDFSGVSRNGELYGACVSVHIDHLKKV